jgi:hypothetical protein
VTTLDGDTERTTLMAMAADYLVAQWLKLKYPTPYKSVRYVNGYVVEVAVREYRTAEAPEHSEASEYE